MITPEALLPKLEETLSQAQEELQRYKAGWVYANEQYAKLQAELARTQGMLKDALMRNLELQRELEEAERREGDWELAMARARDGA